MKVAWLAFGGLVLSLALGCSATPEVSAPPRDLVVLVHGMGRTRFSMWPLARRLEREGYDVLNWGYPSTKVGVAELGASLAEAVDDRPRASGTRVHFVAHSLGNVLVRWVLANDLPPDMGRVVMLAPPNQGAKAADTFLPWLGWLWTPLADLTTAETSAARSLALPPGVEVGVIAGQYDGKVSLEESHLPGETAHVVVPTFHSLVLLREDVRLLMLEFLREGRFAESAGG